MSKSAIFKLCILLFLALQLVSKAQEDSDTSRFAKGEIIIKFKPGYDSPSVASFLENQNLNLRSFITADRWALVGFDMSMDVLSKLQALKNAPIVEWAQPNYIYKLCTTPNDPYFSDQWALQNSGQNFYCSGSYSGAIDADIDATEAWDIEKGDSTLKIAILDSGIPLDSLGNLSHEDLDDTNKFILGWDCGDTSVSECLSAESVSINVGINKHGARVTGVAAAEANNNLGITGILWNCKVDIIKVTIQSGDEIEGWKLSKAIRRAVDDTAKVINLSMAGYPWDDSTFGDRFMESAIAYAESNGVVICAAVGNPSQPTPDSIMGFPGAFASWGSDSSHVTGYRNVIAVGSTQWADLFLNSKYSNSTYKVTVTAPGNRILSTWAPPPFPSLYGCNLGGTSFATPHVTGVAGLVRSKYPDSSAAWVREVIENTADKVWQDPAKAAYTNSDTIYHDWHFQFGFGRVNAFRAVTLKTLKAPFLDSAKVIRDSKDTTHWIKSFWTDISSDEDSFKIYRTVFSTPYQYSKVAATAINVTNYQDHWSNLVGSETYIYRVRTHENISNSGNFSDSAKVKNIPNKPVQKTPLVIQSISQCCLMLAPPGCDPHTNKVIVRWDKPTNQKANSLTKYKIKVRRAGGTVFWFTHNDVSQDTLRDTLCLWSNYTCSLWVYAYDATDSSHASNPKVVLVGPCQVCTPPRDNKITPPFEVSDAVQQPKEFSLSQNYPNPFNPATQISYALPQNADVEMTIYNILGRKIRKFSLGYQTAGYKTVSWDGKDNAGNEVASGIYFYRIVAGDFSQTKKMTLLK